MHHEQALVATIAVGLGLAFVGGLLAQRARLPPLVGYLLAGVAVGPFTPGFVADATLVPQLAEIGVMLLMFGVGLHFSIGDLLAVRAVAVPGALFQIAVATALGIGMARSRGWTWGAGLVFGLALSVASTVVLLRALEDAGRLESPDGRIAIGWLIVGKRLFPWILKRVERTRSRELFTLAVVALALGVAYGAARVFDVSFALGAFFAGVVLAESDLSHRAAAGLQPLQDAFGVLFFVGVGMLFDPSILVRRPLGVLSVLAVVVVGKFAAAVAIVLALRRPWKTALTIAAALAQIGEFSFLLAAMGIELGLLTTDAQSLIVAGSLFSMTLNPVLFRAAVRERRSPRVATA